MKYVWMVRCDVATCCCPRFWRPRLECLEQRLVPGETLGAILSSTWMAALATICQAGPNYDGGASVPLVSSAAIDSDHSADLRSDDRGSVSIAGLASSTFSGNSDDVWLESADLGETEFSEGLLGSSWSKSQAVPAPMGDIQGANLAGDSSEMALLPSSGATGPSAVGGTAATIPGSSTAVPGGASGSGLASSVFTTAVQRSGQATTSVAIWNLATPSAKSEPGGMVALKAPIALRPQGTASGSGIRPTVTLVNGGTDSTGGSSPKMPSADPVEDLSGATTSSNRLF